jgi:GTP-binding protein
VGKGVVRAVVPGGKSTRHLQLDNMAKLIFSLPRIACRALVVTGARPPLASVHTILARAMSSSPKKKAARAQARALPSTAPSASRFRRITVALVGRPNVGKSSLFNRLAQQRTALVHSTPGTTRDWKEAPARLGELEFVVMDTGGLEDRPSVHALENRMLAHTEVAIAHADVVLLMIDARAGVSEEDVRFARWVKQRRPHGGIHLLANKMEGWGGSASAEARYEAAVLEAYALGLGEPTPISAEHGDGLMGIYDILEPYASRDVGEEEGAPPKGVVAAPAVPVPAPAPAALMPAEPEGPNLFPDVSERVAADVSLPSDPRKRKLVMQRLARAAGPVQVTIVGRPNVGKSTLVNQLLGEERVLAGPTPGLTRDVTAVDFTVAGRALRLIDTAGMRRYGAWDLATPLEGEAVGMAKRALERAHVVVLVVDGAGGTAAGLTNDRIRFANRAALEAGSKDVRAMGSPGPGDAKCTALARLASRAAGSTSKADHLPVGAAALAEGDMYARASRSMGRGSAFGMTRQDLSIAEQILDEGRGLVVALTKLDASPEPAEVARVVRSQLDAMHQGKGTCVVPLAALRGRGVEELLPAVLATYDRWNMRTATGTLNSWLQLTSRHHPAPSVSRTVGMKGRGQDRKAVTVPVQLRIKFVTQVAARPPTFAVWANRADLPESYTRYLVNSLREEFGLGGVPVRLHVRTASNPYTAAGRAALSVSRVAKLRAMTGAARLAQLRRGPGRVSGAEEEAGAGAVEAERPPRRPAPKARKPPTASTGGGRGPLREKADAKRAIYAEAADAAAAPQEGDHGGTPKRISRVLSPGLARAARSAALTGGAVRMLSRKELKTMQGLQGQGGSA